MSAYYKTHLKAYSKNYQPTVARTV